MQRCLFSIALASLMATRWIFAAEVAPEGHDFFESKIRPVLVQHCYECHAADAKTLQGGLALDTRESTRRGGDSGAAVVPEKVEDSLLIAALRYEGYEMPPSGKLSEQVIADFVKWVEMGAPDPRDGEPVAESGIDFKTAGEHWAYQPVVKPPRPQVRNAAWCAGELDYFTLAKLEEHQLHPVAPAEKREWIRRATFDLLGLPPTPEEVAAFLNDESPRAYERVVDRLLESAHYGERWGRYWLDVARYSEDQAHTFSVRKNTNGYRYRDWVISAFNADMPYNEFVKLQIAGDLIESEEAARPERLVALGLFGLGAQYYKNSDAAKAAADELDDRVDTLTRGFLGLTVSCARCHDHKFDPIPTQDYYSLAGIFRSSKLHNAPLCSPDEVKAYEAGQKRIKAADQALKKFLKDEKSVAGESKTHQIAQYMQAVWKFQAAAAEGTDLKTADLAKEAGLNEALLKRWLRFLDPKQKGKVAALEAWFVLTSGTEAFKRATTVEVAKVATDFQQQIQTRLDIRNGVSTANLVKVDEEGPHQPGKPRFVTPLVTKARPTAGIEVKLDDAKELFLVVSDGGNGKSCDHADWIEPKLMGPAGEQLLTELKWKSLKGFSGGKINRNYTGQPIRVGGKTYSNGIGVHAPTIIAYDVPAGFDRFQAIGGLDNSGSDQGGCGDQASVQFSVYTEPPVDSPVELDDDLLTVVFGKDGPFMVDDRELENFLDADKQAQLSRMRAELEQAKQTAPEMYPIAHSYTEANAADMKVFVRGNPARQREVAPRRFLRILAGEDRPLFRDGSGRRELAEAIADADNPLTARVFVNRVWQHHFGRGIVSTPSNFGAQGDPPSHPELLDFLTDQFIASGWSTKALHREIMLSSTYRLSTSHDEANANVDADNRYLWQMNRRRLDVEAWRDALLDVAGKLDRTLGGPSTNLADTKNVRRTVYAMISRHELDNLLRLFDFPDANITSAKRSETTVPQQQLFVLNSPFMVEQAKAFADRLHTEAPSSDTARIERAFALAYNRPPSKREIEIGLAYLAGEPHPDDRLTRWQSYAQALLGGNEFIYLD